jgi:hypothetical protein
MRALNLILLMIGLAVLVGCTCRNTPRRILAESADWPEFGTPLTPAMGISLHLLLGAGDGLYLVRDAVIDSVTPDGSSLMLKEERRWSIQSDGAARVRVTLKDLGVVVPADCKGHLVVVRGNFSRPAGDRNEMTIEATGVRIEK